MFVRVRGGGIRHISTRAWDDHLLREHQSSAVMGEDDDMEDSGLENEAELPAGRTQADDEGGEDGEDEGDEGEGGEGDDNESAAENTTQRASYVLVCLHRKHVLKHKETKMTMTRAGSRMGSIISDLIY